MIPLRLVSLPRGGHPLGKIILKKIPLKTCVLLKLRQYLRGRAKPTNTKGNTMNKDKWIKVHQCKQHGETLHSVIEWVTATDEAGQPTMWDSDLVCVTCERQSLNGGN
jgi:hypothetical protein